MTHWSCLKVPGLLFCVLLFLAGHSMLLPSAASAEGISGAVELLYSASETVDTDSTGVSNDRKSDSFTQRYFLNLDKVIYPNLKFQAGGVFEETDTRDDSAGVETDSKSDVRSGLLNLQLNTQLMSTGLGYTRREEQQTILDQPSVPNIMETYTANLGLRPEGLPPLEVLFLHSNIFDKERVSQDNVTDSLNLSTRYEPYKNLNLQGQVSFSDRTDNLADLNIKSAGYSARASYSRQFGERVTAFATYSYSRQETETRSGGGGGEVPFQVFPFSGLSGLSDTPVQVTLDQNPALIDGDVAISSGINLGPPPVGGDERRRNIGVDFRIPSEVNTLYLWVDRDLPENVVNFFAQDIRVYSSADNLNWTELPGAVVVFALFFNRFEITIPSSTARFLKVVTRPLGRGVIVPPGIDVSNIFVTEMQAFLSRPAAEVAGKTTQSSHVYDLNVKWRILDRPLLFYDGYYWSVHSQPSGGSRYVLSNSLNLSHRFNSVFTGAARVGREDSVEGPFKRYAHIYSASVTAVPLPTLLHSLVVSGRFEETGEGSGSSHSVFLNNTAELYRGLNLNLTGGYSISTAADGRRSRNIVLSTGLSAQPHPSMSLNLSYSQNNNSQTGGPQADSSASTRRGDLAVSYTPFSTVYIFASFGMTSESGRETDTVQNYVLTWAPFQGGDLQFNFSYVESINSEGQKERSISPGLTWFMRQNAQLQLVYATTESVTEALNSERKVLSLSLRVAL